MCAGFGQISSDRLAASLRLNKVGRPISLERRCMIAREYNAHSMFFQSFLNLH